jgi:hypothetical protein
MDLLFFTLGLTLLILNERKLKLAFLVTFFAMFQYHLNKESYPTFSDISNFVFQLLCQYIVLFLTNELILKRINLNKLPKLLKLFFYLIICLIILSGSLVIYVSISDALQIVLLMFGFSYIASLLISIYTMLICVVFFSLIQITRLWKSSLK